MIPGGAIRRMEGGNSETIFEGHISLDNSTPALLLANVLPWFQQSRVFHLSGPYGGEARE